MTKDPPVPTKPTKSRRWLTLEWAAAIILGVLAIACFALQAYSASSQTSVRETALYNALQFLLTVGFTWFSTRAVSRNEFEQSLKRFAISAYRRVADIERMVHRLQSEVGDMIRERSSEGVQNLRIVEAIVADTGQVVRSSIADWADVIGEELLAIERIRRLDQERQDIKAETGEKGGLGEQSAIISKLDQQISALLASLPPRLQLEAERTAEPSRHEQHAARWVKRTHERDNGLRLIVVTGKLYDSDRDQGTLTAGERLVAVRGPDRGLDVVDAQGRILGRLQNPSPLTYDGFARAVEICYGNSPLTLAFVRDLDRRTGDDDITGWFEVRVTSTPIIDED